MITKRHLRARLRATVPCRAVTLIELVTGVSALILLTAVLAPALAEVGRRGKDAVCLQNLARIAQASIVYAAQDPDGQAIPVHYTQFLVDKPYTTRVGLYTWGGKSGKGNEGGDTYWWGAKYNRGPATRPLNHILYGDVFPNYRGNPGNGRANWNNDTKLDLGVYRCPADTGWTSGLHVSSWKNSGLTSFDHFGNSYAANVVWIGPGQLGNAYMDSNSPYLHRLADIVNPAETVYYLEGCGQYTYMYAPQASGCGVEDGVVDGWHGAAWMFNVAFVDGHAGTVRLKGTTSPDLVHYPQGSYTYWRCVTIRGPGWQRDTLPLPPTATTIYAPGRSSDSREDDSTACPSFVEEF